MDDLEASKAYIEANIDLVPSKLFLRYDHYLLVTVHWKVDKSFHCCRNTSVPSCLTPLLRSINTPYSHPIATPTHHLSQHLPYQLSALTAQKLSAQSRNDLQLMERIKTVRNRYIVAHDQMFFPLNIEVP